MPWIEQTYRNPFTRICPFLMVGIYLSEKREGGQEIPTLWILLGLGICGLILLSILFVKPYKYRWLYGAVLLFLFVIIGFLLGANRVAHPQIKSPSKGIFLIRVREQRLIRKGTTQLKAEILAFHKDQRWLSCNQMGIFYLDGSKCQFIPAGSEGDLGNCKIEGNENSILFEDLPGEMLLVQGSTYPITNNGNPCEFNYKDYFRRKGFSCKGTLKKCFIIPGEKEILIGRDCNRKYEQLLERGHLSLQVKQLAMAMVVGEQSGLDGTLKNGFKRAGVYHVLAISGLHVGVMCLLPLWLLRFPGRPGRRRWWKGGALLVIVWSYALLVGLKPSVSRASIMFSSWIIGKCVSKTGQAEGVFSATFLVLLIWCPNWLWDVGFWLSFSALWAIFFIPFPFLKKRRVLGGLPKKVLNVFWICLIAWIATAPICLYCFHKLSFWGLISGGIVVPLVSLFLYGNIFLILFSLLFPTLGYFPGKIVEVIGRLILDLINCFGTKSGGIFVTDCFPTFSLIMAGVGLCALTLAFGKKEKKYLKVCFGAYLFSLVPFCCRLFFSKPEQVVVWNLNGITAINVINNCGNWCFYDAKEPKSRERLFRAGEFFWSGYPCPQPEMISIDQVWKRERVNKEGFCFRKGVVGGEDVFFGIFKVLPKVRDGSLLRIKMEFVVVIGDEMPPEETDFQVWPFRQVVLAHRMPPWRVEKWVQWTRRQNLPLWDVTRQGAYIWKKRNKN